MRKSYISKITSPILIPLLLSCFCPILHANKASFPEYYETDNGILSKRGEYRYVYRYFFELYDAALFTEPSAQTNDVLQAYTTYHLEFRYLREIDRSIILKSADKMLERNLSRDEIQQIQIRVDQINDAYQTVRKGDHSSLIYNPDTGTTLSINGKTIITIPGQDFAQLYFRIWLGEQAISDTMKATLLGDT